MRYAEPENVGRDALEHAQEDGDVDQICSSLIGLVFHDDDREWLQGACLNLIRHEIAAVRMCAANGFGHIARIYGEIDKDLVLPELEILRSDPIAEGAAEDALEDIYIFVP